MITSLVGGLVVGRTHVAREAAGSKKQRDQLRAAMHDQGCTPEQITAEMARRFGFRPRQAWRHTHGWTQDEVAAAYNRLLNHDQAPMTGKRISDFEAWPHGGVKPTTNTLAILAILYSTTPSKLVDLDDRQALSAQELIALDTHTPPPTTPRPPNSLHPNTNTTHPTTTGQRATPLNPDTSTTTDHPDHTPEEKTAHQLLVHTRVPSQHHRWHLIVASLLAIATIVSSGIIMRATTINSQPATPARTSPPLVSSSPFAPGPSSTSLLSPPLTWQTPLPPHQLLMSVSPFARPVPAPHQPFLPLPPEQATPPAPPMQQTPPLFSTRPDPPPPPSEQPTTKASTTAIIWKNMHYGLCLDEQEEDVTHDPGTLRLLDCNGGKNQMWIEKSIPTHPTSIAKNLVSVRSGKCVTYEPDPDYGIVSVWLAPCGKEGQAWIQAWNGVAYMFETAELHGICMSVPNGTGAEGFIGILLRQCDPPSPLTDWRPY
jgi:hypothetical protein